MIENEKERYWLAGLLEGEGCFSLDKGRYPKFTLNMTDLDVIERVADLIGYTNKIYMQDMSKYNVVSKKTYSIAWGGKKAVELMLTIRDLMGKRRREYIDRLLATCE